MTAVDGRGVSGQNPGAVSRSPFPLGFRGRISASLLCALAAVAVLVAAGCGGGGSEKAYGASATRSCLEKAGVEIVPVDESSDLVASSALGGSLGARLAANHVTISFGRDATEGDLLRQAYTRYGSRDVPIDQVLERRRNAVLLWAGAPTRQDADVVRSCLES